MSAPVTRARAALVAAAGVAILLGACGSSRSSDVNLARRILSRDLVLVRRSLPGATARNGSARTALSCSSALTAFAHAARARSPTISYRHELQLRAATYVFANNGDATRALDSYVSGSAQTCIASSTAASLQRSGYTTTAPHTSVAPVHGIGQAAVGAEVTIPASLRGRPFTFRLDSTLVRAGRVVSLLDTFAGRSSAAYNRRLASAFARNAAELQ